jgi:hypothetical protein
MSQKISQMTSGNPAQSGDIIPIVRSGANRIVTVDSIAALAGGNLKTVTVPITSAEILNLAATPKSILPGVAGVSYFPQFATLAYHPGTKGYVDPTAGNTFVLTSVDAAVTTSYSLTDAVPHPTPGDLQHTKYDGSISGGGSNALANYFAGITGFSQAPNDGSFYIDGSTTSSVNIQNPSGVAETASGTLTVGTAVYHGTVTGGDSDAFAGLWFVINSFTNPANNGLFYCVASDATSLTLANFAAVAETASAIASNVSYNSSHQEFDVAFTSQPFPGAGAPLIAFYSPLAYAVIRPSSAVTWMCGTLIPQISYSFLANLNPGGNGTAAGEPIVLLLRNSTNPPVALTGGDGTMTVSLTYLQVTV